MKYNLTDTVRDMLRVKLILLHAGKALSVVNIIDALEWQVTPTSRSRVYSLLALIGASSDREENGRKGYGKYTYRATDADREFARAMSRLAAGDLERWQTAETKLEDLGFEWNEKHHLWLKSSQLK